MHTCVICRRVFEGENPAILHVSKYGTPRELCPDCEKLLDVATSGGEGADAAREKLYALSSSIREADSMRVLREVLSGTASPEEEEAEEREIEEEYEAVRMTPEEEAEEQARQAEQEKKDNSFLSWLPVILIGVAAVALFCFFWFRR